MNPPSAPPVSPPSAPPVSPPSAPSSWRAAVTPLVLGRAAVALPALAAGWLLAALPLLLLGGYRPVPAAPIALVCAVLAAAYAVRGAPRLAGPAWPALLTLAIVAGFLVLAWGWSGEHVAIRRDAGSYALYAHWLAGHGALPIPAPRSIFGPAVGVGSPAYYPDGSSVVPQFMSGAPLVLAVGGWLGGLPGILHADAVVGAAALLTVAGLAARVAGPRVAPLAAAATGLAYPVLHAARAPYSEPLALLLLFGGLALLADRSLPFAGGLLAGLATLVRIDAPADLLLLAPWVVLTRDRRAGFGLAVGVGLGLLDGVVLSRPYLLTVAGELAALAAAAVVLVVAAFVVRRRRGRPRWLPAAAGAVVLLAAVGCWLRPLVQHVHRSTAARFMIGALQQQQGLRREPTRTYDEYALHWVSWWLGLPLLVLGVVGLALLVRRRLRGPTRRPDPAPFLLVLAGAALVLLYKPSITPDHPWADRRFVPAVLPGLAVCAAWTVRQLPRLVPARLPTWVGRAAAAVVALLALVPAGLATAPLATAATERGELAAVRQLCDPLGPDAAVVVTGSRGRNELPQTLRDLCAVPVGVLDENVLGRDLPGVQAQVRAAGRRLVVVAETPDVLRAAGLHPQLAAAVQTREDARTLTRRPDATVPLELALWLARP